MKITPNAKLVEKFPKAKRLLTFFASKRRFSGSPGHHIVQISTKFPYHPQKHPFNIPQTSQNLARASIEQFSSTTKTSEPHKTAYARAVCSTGSKPLTKIPFSAADPLKAEVMRISQPRGEKKAHGSVLVLETGQEMESDGNFEQFIGSRAIQKRNVKNLPKSTTPGSAGLPWIVHLEIHEKPAPASLWGPERSPGSRISPTASSLRYLQKSRRRGQTTRNGRGDVVVFEGSKNVSNRHLLVPWVRLAFHISTFLSNFSVIFLTILRNSSQFFPICFLSFFFFFLQTFHISFLLFFFCFTFLHFFYIFSSLSLVHWILSLRFLHSSFSFILHFFYFSSSSSSFWQNLSLFSFSSSSFQLFHFLGS